MTFLIDMPLSPALVEWLVSQGHKAFHASHRGMSTASDKEILKLACKEGCVVITADLDFPRLIALSGSHAPPLILFRGGNYTEAEMRELIARVLKVISPAELAKSLVVVDKARIRKVRLPIFG